MGKFVTFNKIGTEKPERWWSDICRNAHVLGSIDKVLSGDALYSINMPYHLKNRRTGTIQTQRFTLFSLALKLACKPFTQPSACSSHLIYRGAQLGSTQFSTIYYMHKLSIPSRSKWKSSVKKKWKKTQKVEFTSFRSENDRNQCNSKGVRKLSWLSLKCYLSFSQMNTFLKFSANVCVCVCACKIMSSHAIQVWKCSTLCRIIQYYFRHRSSINLWFIQNSN